MAQTLRPSFLLLSCSSPPMKSFDACARVDEPKPCAAAVCRCERTCGPNIDLPVMRVGPSASSLPMATMARFVSVSRSNSAKAPHSTSSRTEELRKQGSAETAGKGARASRPPDPQRSPMRAQRALLLAFAALVARTEAECPGKHDRDYDPNCIEDNMEPKLGVSASASSLITRNSAIGTLAKAMHMK